MVVCNLLGFWWSKFPVLYHLENDTTACSKDVDLDLTSLGQTKQFIET
jgi:hypothetical protein